MRVKHTYLPKGFSYILNTAEKRHCWSFSFTRNVNEKVSCARASARPPGPQKPPFLACQKVAPPPCKKPPFLYSTKCRIFGPRTPPPVAPWWDTSSRRPHTGSRTPFLKNR